MLSLQRAKDGLRTVLYRDSFKTKITGAGFVCDAQLIHHQAFHGQVSIRPAGLDSLEFERKNRIVPGLPSVLRLAMHKTIEPTILYFGTPVALISTLNEDGTANLAPMSSAWWLGWSCMLGLGTMGQTSENLIRTRQCVINLPSQDQVSHVDRLALTTGRNPVPEKKLSWGYRHESDKFGIAGFTAAPSIDVMPPRVAECPVQMEGIVHAWSPFGKNVSANCFEIHIVKLHVDESLLLSKEEGRPHVDPVKWRPLIMSFCRFFGIGEEVHSSRLAESDFMKFVRNGTANPQPASSRSSAADTRAEA